MGDGLNDCGGPIFSLSEPTQCRNPTAPEVDIVDPPSGRGILLYVFGLHLGLLGVITQLRVLSHPFHKDPVGGPKVEV